MTEFDLALDFLQNYVRVSAEAAELGESVDDQAEFRRHCDPLGIEVTAERVDLVRDMAGVVKECLVLDEANDESRHVIPAACLAEGLERYGWRIAYLNRSVLD